MFFWIEDALIKDLKLKEKDFIEEELHNSNRITVPG